MTSQFSGLRHQGQEDIRPLDGLLYSGEYGETEKQGGIH